MSGACMMTTLHRLLNRHRLSVSLHHASLSTRRLASSRYHSILDYICPMSSATFPRRLLHTSRTLCGFDSDEFLKEIDFKPSSVSRDNAFVTKELSKLRGKKKMPPQQNSVDIDVHSGMNLVEISQKANLDLHKVWRIVSSSEEFSKIRSEKFKINDEELLLKVCQALNVNGMIEGRSADKQEILPQKNLTPRPPVITIMGHIDHGKTTLLGALRKSNLVDLEFGGITQHIGAFSVKTSTGSHITFLDTPGHAAFAAMRERGALVTDIIVLVVSADDGVMPQTIESIEYAQKYDVPLVIAINKIDRPNADVERTLNSLLEHGIQTELNGGDIPAVPISALMGENLSELQDTIAVLAEILDLRSDLNAEVQGHVIESKMDPKVGLVATVLVQEGTLKVGTILIAGESIAKVKKMVDEYGQSVKSILPSFCAEVHGWKTLPEAGDQVLEVKNMKKAQERIALLSREKKMADQEQDELHSLDLKRREEHKEIMKTLYRIKQNNYWKYINAKQKVIQYGYLPSTLGEYYLPIILKADVYGSIEALLGIFSKFDSHLCELRVVHHEVGPVNEADINLAESLNAEVFCFNVPVPADQATSAEKKNVVIKQHNVIYSLIDDLRKSGNSRIPPTTEENIKGEADVLEVFEYKFKNGKRMVAGCRCTEGSLLSKLDYKVLRNGEEVFSGKLDSLKHHRDEVNMIEAGKDCGVLVNDPDFLFEVGDMLVCFENKTVQKTLDWAPG
uniref:Translation initiation factor IF-2, mitochondrial n=1 Tax=Crassostrea virginica TaxID=6565 RepID=A0A8B8E434_CRAVI|nr:uncharacterized protein LOC111131638 [Crassostrea virginica]